MRPSDSVPKHLLRSSWRDLSDPELRAGIATFRLESVSDLPAAPNVASLVDSEDAFLLTFSGPKAIASPGVPMHVRHAELGSFDIAVGPGGDGHYHAVVNRGAQQPGEPADAAAARPAFPDRAAAGRRGPRHTHRRAGVSGSGRRLPSARCRNKVIRKVEAKRAKHGAKCVVELDSPADIDELTAWLKRDDRIVATASRRVRGKRVAFNLKGGKKRFRNGVYELSVIALGEDGEQHARNVRVRLK